MITSVQNGKALLSTLSLWRALMAASLIFILPWLFAPSALAESIKVRLADEVFVGDRFMSVRWLGALRLRADGRTSPPVSGLSDLAWDQEQELLYAVSDRGWLLHLRLALAEGELRSAEVKAGYRLRGPDGVMLSGRRADAEGMALRQVARGDQVTTELIVSFESEPRIWRYSIEGVWQGEVSLPTGMSQNGYFDSPNRGLEAIALHPRFGLLVAPERTPKRYREGHVPMRDWSGHVWHYPLAAIPESALTAMEFLADGSLITLERAFVSPLVPLLVSLRQTCLPAPPRSDLVIHEAARFDAGEGWTLDNFEGLTRLGRNRLLMVSDDNARAVQATFLVYLEVLSGTPGCGEDGGS